MRQRGITMKLCQQRTVGRGPLARRPVHHLPHDHRLPAIYRQVDRDKAETFTGGELAREPALARLEAALFA